MSTTGPASASGVDAPERLGAGASSGDVPLTSDGYADTPIVRELQSLVGSQTPREIEHLRESTEPVEVLMSEDGTPLAALKSPGAPFQPYVSPVGPGCTTTSACLTTQQGVPYGWTGGGSIGANVPHGLRGAAGAEGYDTGFWSGNTLFLALNRNVVNIPDRTITRVVRTPH